MHLDVLLLLSSLPALYIYIYIARCCLFLCIGLGTLSATVRRRWSLATIERIFTAQL
jgi:hypothetical protein